MFVIPPRTHFFSHTHTHTKIHSLFFSHCYGYDSAFDCYGEVNRKIPDGKFGVQCTVYISMYIIAYLFHLRALVYVSVYSTYISVDGDSR